MLHIDRIIIIYACCGTYRMYVYYSYFSKFFQSITIAVSGDLYTECSKTGARIMEFCTNIEHTKYNSIYYGIIIQIYKQLNIITIMYYQCNTRIYIIYLIINKLKQFNNYICT